MLFVICNNTFGVTRVCALNCVSLPFSFWPCDIKHLIEVNPITFFCDDSSFHKEQIAPVNKQNVKTVRMRTRHS